MEASYERALLLQAGVGRHQAGQAWKLKMNSKVMYSFDDLDQVVAQVLSVGVVAPHSHVVREEVWLRVSRVVCFGGVFGSYFRSV